MEDEIMEDEMMKEGQKALARYIIAATELAESVKKDVQLGANKISEKTTASLNAFIVESTAFKYWSDGLTDAYIEFNN